MNSAPRGLAAARHMLANYEQGKKDVQQSAVDPAVQHNLQLLSKYEDARCAPTTTTGLPPKPPHSSSAGCTGATL